MFIESMTRDPSKFYLRVETLGEDLEQTVFEWSEETLKNRDSNQRGTIAGQQGTVVGQYFQSQMGKSGVNTYYLVKLDSGIEAPFLPSELRLL